MNSKFEYSFLKYGSIFSFHDFNYSNFSISAEGFINSRIYLSEYDYNSLFLLVPHFMNANKKNITNLSKELSKSSISFQEKKQVIEDLREKLREEYLQNLETQNKYKESPVNYGQVIQFLHVISNKFLSIKFEEAEEEKENYKIALCEGSSDFSFFKIMPCYKYQKESEGKIYFNEPIYIAHAFPYVNKLLFLHSKPMFIVKERITIKLLPSNSRSNESKSTKQKKSEINASFESPSKFRIKEFSIFKEENKEKLSYGDVIWIKSLEFDSTISAIAIEQNNEYIKISLPSEFIITLMKIYATDEINKYVGNKNSLWLIEHVDFINGGLVETDHFFRIKHLSTGFFLSAVIENENRFQFILDNKKANNGIFCFKKTDNNSDNYITKDSVVHIFSKEHQKYIGIDFLTSNEDSAKNFKKENENNNYLVFEEHPKDQDVFKIISVRPNEVLEINFLIHCMKIMKKFLRYLRNLAVKT